MLNDATARTAALQGGQVHMINRVEPKVADLLKRVPGLEVKNVSGRGHYVFIMHTNTPPFDNIHMRLALKFAIDREEMTQTVLKGLAIPGNSLLTPGYPGYNPDIAALAEFNPDKARELLATAGFPHGKGLPEIELLYNTGSNHENIAQAVAQMWSRNLGLNVITRGLERKVFAERVHNGDFMVARNSWIGDYPDPTTFLDLFTSGGSNNDAHFSDKRYDALLKKAAVTLDPPARFALLRQGDQGGTLGQRTGEQGGFGGAQFGRGHRGAQVMLGQGQGPALDAPGIEFVQCCFRPAARDRKSTRLNSSHTDISRMPSSA